MTDYTELQKAAAYAAQDTIKFADEHEEIRALQQFHEEVDPETVLALIADLDEARNGMKYSCAIRLKKQIEQLEKERDQLKAENEALRKALAECADSLHGEMLQKFGGQLPDDMHPVSRREYDRDMAEVAGYRAAMGKGEQS